jgi:periplasmic protein TonB
MKRGLLFSIAIHALFIFAITALGSYAKKDGSYARKEAEPVVVSLVSESGGGGQAGEATKKAKLVPQKRRPVSAKTRMPHAYSDVPPTEPPPAVQERHVELETAVSRAVSSREESVSAPSSAEQALSGTDGGSGGGHGMGAGTGVGSGRGTGSGSGSGAGSGDGRGGSDGPGYGHGETATALKNRYLREHFSYIKDLIYKNLTYPLIARKQGWEGVVTVSFTILETGNVENIRILQTSGFDILDRNLVATIRLVQPFPKPPVKAELTIPVRYHLE